MYPNIKALIKALGEIGMPFNTVEDFEDAVMVGAPGEVGRFFIRANTPFNSESVGGLCKDKDCLYKSLEGKISMPKTKSFLDPKGNFVEIFNKSLDFAYPRIVKMNQGERGRNVFLVKNDDEFKLALENIFDSKSQNYDYIALVQEYIEVYREFRVIIQNRSVSFAYDREGMKILPDDFLATIKIFVKPILETIDLKWGAIDLIESKTGDIFFLEANTRPSFEGFIEKNGDSKIVELYKNALQ